MLLPGFKMEAPLNSPHSIPRRSFTHHPATAPHSAPLRSQGPGHDV